MRSLTMIAAVLIVAGICVLAKAQDEARSAVDRQTSIDVLDLHGKTDASTLPILAIQGLI